MEDREARLAKARAAKSDIEGRRAARAQVAEAEAEVVNAEREVRDLQALEAAESEHGAVGTEIATVETPQGLVILKKAHPLLFRRFQDVAKFTTAELEKLVRPCVVYPDASAFDALLESLPAKLQECANAVCELAGARSAEIAKK